MEKIVQRRALNSSRDEIAALSSLIAKLKDVVECKKSDTVLWKEKEAAWENIATKLVKMGFPLRTTKQLREKWGNLKKEQIRKYGEEKVESFKTGGGQKKIINITSNDEKIKSIIGVAITGDCNVFDSDNPSAKGCIDPDVGVGNLLNVDEERIQEQTKETVKDKKQISGKYVIINKSNIQAIPSSCQEKLCMPEVTAENHKGNTFENSAKDTHMHSKPLIQKTPTRTGMKRKTILTADCRLKINLLLEAKLDLVKVQKECLQKEISIKNEEHNLHMQHAKDEHVIKMRKHSVELKLLEMELYKKTTKPP